MKIKTKQKLMIASIILAACGLLMLLSLQTAGQSDDATTTTDNNAGLRAIGAGIAVGFAGIGSGIGMGIAGASALGAITEKPDLFTKSLIFIVLIEAVAIYGFLIAILSFTL